MYKPFFPSIEFAWGFLIFLGAVLALAAYVDWRKTVIPKWLTLGMLGLGVLASVVRGAWLGALGQKLWLFEQTGLFLGVLDGFFFALLGCVCGFLMLFLLWLFGTCGGGDVKLFAALGAWVGPVYAIFVLAASMIVLIVELGLKVATVGFSKKKLYGETGKKSGKAVPGSWRITYSLPVAIATVVVILWFFRVELGLAQPAPTPLNSDKVQANGR